MRKDFLFCISLFLLLPSYIFAQTIQGKIIDRKTGLGIAFTSIGVVGTNEVTVSNENGDYVLKIASYPAKIKFSHISYIKTEVTLTQRQEQLSIQLMPANIGLREVVIKPYQAEKLLIAALKKAKENSENHTYAKSFYRQLTAINDNPSEIYELFYDLKWSPVGIKGWLAKQSRFASSKENLNFTINNQSFLTFIFSGMLLPEKSGKFIRLETIKEYIITVDRFIEQTDQQVAVITCRLKKPSRKEMYVNSTYYIGTVNSNIYRLENQLINLPNNFKYVNNNTKLAKPTLFTTVSTFKSENDGIPKLESIATKLNVAILAEKKPYNINVTSLLSIYRIDDDLKKQGFIALSGNINDKKVIESIKYDANFWKNNPIVKQTTLEDTFIKMMESKQAFGTMTNP